MNNKQKLQNLMDNAHLQISELIKEKGEDSKHSNEKVLKIKFK